MKTRNLLACLVVAVTMLQSAMAELTPAQLAAINNATQETLPAVAGALASKNLDDVGEIAEVAFERLKNLKPSAAKVRELCEALVQGGPLEAEVIIRMARERFPELWDIIAAVVQAAVAERVAKLSTVELTPAQLAAINNASEDKLAKVAGGLISTNLNDVAEITRAACQRLKSVGRSNLQNDISAQALVRALVESAPSQRLKIFKIVRGFFPAAIIYHSMWDGMRAAYLKPASEWNDDMFRQLEIISLDAEKVSGLMPGQAAKFKIAAIYPPVASGTAFSSLDVKGLKVAWAVLPANEGVTFDPESGELRIGPAAKHGQLIRLTANVENGRLIHTKKLWVYTAQGNPLVGSWREESQLTCGFRREVRPEMRIVELSFQPDVASPQMLIQVQ